jgi:hypothetical protein
VGEDPEQLEREIEATRAKLGADIDALEEKVNPKKVAHRSVESAKEKATEVAAGVKDQVVGAVGSAKDKLSSDQSGPAGSGNGSAGLVSTAKEKAAPLVGTAKEKAGPLIDSAMAKAAPLVGSAREKAGPLADTTMQNAGSFWATLQQQTRQNPALVGAAAFVVGFLIGR